jgi:hypothetical protein
MQSTASRMNVLLLLVLLLVMLMPQASLRQQP